MDDYGVTTLWHFDNGGVVRTFGAVILGEFRAEAASLDTDHRVELRVEVSLTAKDLCCDLIFLDLNAGMFDGLFGEVT